MRILFVEDEYRLAEALAQILRMHTYTVDIANDGETGLDFALSNVYDLFILDIMLPGRDGLSVLEEVRKAKIATPVLMLTARGEVLDKIKGLDLGADDYLSKPFNSDELLARVRALLRRKGEIIQSDELICQNIRLNHMKLKIGNGIHEIDITKKEADLLEFLILSKGQVLSKTRITEKLWGFESEAEYNNVEVYMSFLRKKLNFLNADISIKTKRGIGYILEDNNV